MTSFLAEKNARLDMALVTGLHLHSRREAQRLIDAGAVSIEGKAAEKASLRVKAGQCIEVLEAALEAKRASALVPEAMDLPVLYEDDACMVISKPAGVAVHPAPGIPEHEPTILHGVAKLFQNRRLPFSEDSVLVHRLDKETTGCLLIAKTPKAHHRLQKQFEERTVRKQYLALVAGVPSPPSAVIDAPIGRHSGNRTKMAVFEAVQNRREAKTAYATLARTSDAKAALLLCDLYTGRTHQIRVHLKAIGHPIIGDGTYESAQSKAFGEKHVIDHLCLHAWRLRFRSPADDEEHQIICPLPPRLEHTLRDLEIEIPQVKEKNSHVV